MFLCANYNSIFLKNVQSLQKEEEEEEALPQSKRLLLPSRASVGSTQK